MAQYRYLLFASLIALFLFTWGVEASPQRSTAIKVILDTDFSTDADDVGAVAVLHNLATQAEALEILGMMISSGDKWSARALFTLNNYFGKPNVPIGVVRSKAVNHESSYTAVIAETSPPQINKNWDSVELYRKILASQKDNSVTIVSIGYLTNLSNLLGSKGDLQSPLSGVELVKQKVKRLVCMGGDYPEGREWNFFQDPMAAQTVATHWPTEIIFVGYTLGLEVVTGPKLRDSDESSPIRLAYKHHNGFKGRPSWDQLAVLFAAVSEQKQEQLFTLSRPGVNTVRADGSNFWSEKSNGTHYVLGLSEDAEQVAGLIEDLMTGK